MTSFLNQFVLIMADILIFVLFRFLLTVLTQLDIFGEEMINLEEKAKTELCAQYNFINSLR